MTYLKITTTITITTATRTTTTTTKTTIMNMIKMKLKSTTVTTSWWQRNAPFRCRRHLQSSPTSSSIIIVVVSNCRRPCHRHLSPPPAHLISVSLVVASASSFNNASIWVKLAHAHAFAHATFALWTNGTIYIFVSHWFTSSQQQRIEM